jgi:hypothetical protein
MSGLADFWHRGGAAPEPTVEAVRINVYQCGNCRVAIDVSHWPTRCPKGHLNVKPE